MSDRAQRQHLTILTDVFFSPKLLFPRPCVRAEPHIAPIVASMAFLLIAERLLLSFKF